MKKDKRKGESDHTFVDVKPTCFWRAEKPPKAPADNLVERVARADTTSMGTDM